MGMVIQLRRGSSAQVDALRTQSDYETFIAPDDYDALPNGVLMDLDKSWHAIHFLVAGTADDAPLPAGALLCGAPVSGEDYGVGPIRRLNPSQVKAFAALLAEKPDDFIETSLDFAALAAADVYPSIWSRRDPEDIVYVSGYFRELKTFFANAAANGESVVLAIM